MKMGSMGRADGQTDGPGATLNAAQGGWAVTREGGSHFDLQVSAAADS